MSVRTARFSELMGVGRLLAAGLALYLENFSVLLRISLLSLMFFLPVNATIIATSGGGSFVLSAAVALEPVLELLFVCVITVAVNDIARGAQPAVTTSYARVLAAIQPLGLLFLRGVGLVVLGVFVWSGLLVSSFVIPGLWHLLVAVPLAAAGIVALIWASVRWAFSLQFVVIEGTNSGEALRRSAELVKGHWLRAFAILAMAIVVPFIVEFTLRLVLVAVFDFDDYWAYPPVVAIQVLSRPFWSIMWALVFFDLLNLAKQRLGANS